MKGETEHFIEESLLGVTPEIQPSAGSSDAPFQKPVKIAIPPDTAEEAGITGWIVSHKMREMTGRRRITIPKAAALSTDRHKLASVAEQIAADGDGAPVVGTNYIRVWVDADHPNAGSNADFIWMYFGTQRRITLWGISPQRFPAGWWLQWDLNTVQPPGYVEGIPSDSWDNITLVNPFGDGIKIDRVKIVHSGVEILDWSCNLWLDGSKLEAHGKVNLTAPMLSHKLSMVGNNWVPQIHWAARELGKTDGTKYGSTGQWCSEFASWCLRKEMWMTPTGNIGSQVMEGYFADRARMYTQAQILNGTYVLYVGDYVRFEWPGGGHHSAIFRHYVDDAANPTGATRIATIEGNAASTVTLRTRKLTDVLSVGNTR